GFRVADIEDIEAERFCQVVETIEFELGIRIFHRHASSREQVNSVISILPPEESKEKTPTRAGALAPARIHLPASGKCGHFTANPHKSIQKSASLIDGIIMGNDHAATHQHGGSRAVLVHRQR